MIALQVYADDLVNDIEQLFGKADMPIKPVLNDTQDNQQTFGQLDLDTKDNRMKPKDGTLDRSRSRTHLVATVGHDGWAKVRMAQAEVIAKAKVIGGATFCLRLLHLSLT